MSTQVQYRRGTEAQNNAFTGALAEITVDTTNWTLRVHDGATAGGTTIINAGSSQTLANKTYTGTSLSVTGNVTGGNIFTAGTANVGNLIVTQTHSVTGNITGGNIISLGLVSGNSLSITETATAGNVYANSGTIGASLLTGTLTTTAQPNVTSVGNLSSLVVIADITSGNVYANAGTIGASLLTGTLTTNAQPNVTSLGNLLGLNVTGDVNVIDLYAGNVYAIAGVVSANLLTGTLTTNAQPNITSVGSLNGLTVSGNIIPSVDITYDLGNATNRFNDLYLAGNSIFLGNVVISADGDNLNLNANVLTANFLTGTLTTNAQPNVTSVGTLTSLSVSGNVDAGNLSGTNIVGTLTTAVQNNITSVGTLTSLSVSGNVDAGNLSGTSITGTLTTAAQNNITSVGTLTSLSVSGTTTANTINSTGQISTTGNIVGGNIITNALVQSDTVSATGTVTVGNVVTGGTITATGNIQSNGTVNANTISSVSGALTVSTNSGDLILSPSGNIDASNNYVNNLPNPVQAQDAATKEYVDNAASTGITIHTPVRLESPTALNGTYAQGGNTYTVNQTIAGNTVVFSSAANLQPNDQLWFSNSFEGILANTAYFVVSTPNTSAAVLSLSYSGAPVNTITSNTGLTQSVRVNSGVGATLTNAGANATLQIDGVTVSTNDRILIYQQANAAHNGVYVVTEAGNATTAWQLTRSSDMNKYAPNDINGVDAGDYFYVQSGDTGAGESYVMTDPVGPFIIGYDNLTFTQFSASQVYTANTAAGLTLNGTVFSAKVDNETTAFSSGNIVVKAGANLVTPNIGAATGTSLSLTGTASVGNVSTTGTVSATGNITGGNLLFGSGDVSGTGNVFATNLTGTLQTAAQPNITSVGTLSSLIVSGTTTSGNLATAGTLSVGGTTTAAAINSSGQISTTGNVVAGAFYGSATGLSSIPGANVTGTVANATYATSAGSATTATSATTAGTVTTAAQGNITSVGTLTSLSVSGTTTGAKFVGGTNANPNTASNYGLQASGAYGGGVSLLDGAAAIGLYSTAGTLNFGFGTSTGITSKATIDTNGNITATNLITSGSGGNITGANVVSATTILTSQIQNSGSNGVGNIGNSSTYFNTVFAKATSAQYADLAEAYAADAEYPPGTVLVFGGDAEVTISTIGGDTAVAGVVSTNPAHVMNSGLTVPNTVVLALTGRVPTRVIGPVRKGQMMVSAENGYAQACTTPAMGSVIGKALENFDGDRGVIEVVVGRL